VPEEITQMEGKSGSGEGAIYDVYRLTLDKKKLDKLCLDTQHKETPREFGVSVVFHKPKVQKGPLASPRGGTNIIPTTQDDED